MIYPSPPPCSILISSRGLSPHRHRQQEPRSVSERPQGATSLPSTAAAAGRATSAAAAAATTTFTTATAASATAQWNDSSPASTVGKLQEHHSLCEASLQTERLSWMGITSCYCFVHPTPLPQRQPRQQCRTNGKWHPPNLTLQFAGLVVICLLSVRS